MDADLRRRQSLTPSEQQVLDFVARNQAQGHWVRGIEVRYGVQGANDDINRALGSLGPDFLQESGEGEGDRYAPTLHGLLQSCNLQPVMELMAALFHFFRERLNSDLQFDRYTWGELRRALYEEPTSAEQFNWVASTIATVGWANESGGKPNNDDFSWYRPKNVEDLARLWDIPSYLHYLKTGEVFSAEVDRRNPEVLGQGVAVPKGHTSEVPGESVEPTDPIVKSTDPIAKIIDPIAKIIDPIAKIIDPIAKITDPIVKLAETMDPIVKLTGTIAPAVKISDTVQVADEVTATVEPIDELSGTIEPIDGLMGTIESSDLTASVVGVHSDASDAGATGSPKTGSETPVPSSPTEATPKHDGTLGASHANFREEFRPEVTEDEAGTGVNGRDHGVEAGGLDASCYATALRRVLESLDGETCIALFAPWGGGKSYVAHKLHEQLDRVWWTRSRSPWVRRLVSKSFVTIPDDERDSLWVRSRCLAFLQVCLLRVATVLLSVGKKLHLGRPLRAFKRPWGWVENRYQFAKQLESWKLLRQLKPRPPYKVIEFSAWRYRREPAVWAHLYERVVDNGNSRFGGSATRVRHNLHSVGALPLIAAFLSSSITLKSAKLETAAALAVSLGITGVITAFSLYWALRKPVKRLQKYYFTIPSHDAVLGLQAAIGRDLTNYVKAWRGDLKWHWLLIPMTMAIMCLALQDRVSAGYGIENGAIAGAVGVLVLAVVCLWVTCFGKASRILLIVDDVDRCHHDEIVNLVESLKLLVEEEALRASLQILVLAEETRLRSAIHERHVAKQVSGETAKERQLLVDQWIEKLFTAWIRLERIDPHLLGDAMWTEAFGIDGPIEREMYNDIRRDLNHRSPVVDPLLSSYGGVAPRPIGRIPWERWRKEENGRDSGENEIDEDKARENARLHMEGPENGAFSRWEAVALATAVRTSLFERDARGGMRAARSVATRYQVARELQRACGYWSDPKELIHAIASGSTADCEGATRRFANMVLHRAHDDEASLTDDHWLT